MRFVYLLLLIIAVGAYGLAFTAGDPARAESWSDIGNAVLLFDIALMLVLERLEGNG